MWVWGFTKPHAIPTIISQIKQKFTSPLRIALGFSHRTTGSPMNRHKKLKLMRAKAGSEGIHRWKKVSHEHGSWNHWSWTLFISNTAYLLWVCAPERAVQGFWKETSTVLCTWCPLLVVYAEYFKVNSRFYCTFTFEICSDKQVGKKIPVSELNSHTEGNSGPYVLFKFSLSPILRVSFYIWNEFGCMNGCVWTTNNVWIKNNG